MPFLQLENVSLHYEEAGQGPVIVCLHGWASSVRLWERTLARLCGRYRVLALDLPGFGDSDKPAAGYSISRFAAVVQAFCAARAIPKATLIGHSMGGMIAAQLALSWPQGVSQLILVNAAVTGRLAYGLHYALKTDLGRRLLVRSHQMQIVARWGQQHWERLGHPALPLVGGVSGVALRRSLEDFNKTTVASAVGGLNAVMTTNLSARLHLIAVPTLVIVGDRDRTLPVSDSLLLAERIPGARLAVIAGASHLPMDERPEEFDRLLDDFLG